MAYCSSPADEPSALHAENRHLKDGLAFLPLGRNAAMHSAQATATDKTASLKLPFVALRDAVEELRCERIRQVQKAGALIKLAAYG